MKSNLIQGDSLEVLKTLPDESINCCMTSPPYWALRDYGTANWEGGNPECNHQIGRNTRGGLTKKQIGNKGGWADEAVKNGECCPICGAKRVDKQLGLEPTFDQYINKLCDIFDEVKRVLRDDGTCWVNIGDTYNAGGNYRGKELGDGSKEVYSRKDFEGCKNDKNAQGIQVKSLCNIPARFSIEMQNRGWILRNVIIWHKPNCMPSSVKDRFTVDFEYLYFFVKNKKYCFEQQLEPLADSSLKDPRLDNGREEHIGKSASGIYGCNATTINSKGRNKRTVWRICPKPFKEAHFAVYPEELCETPIKAGCPTGGVVLDPFCGAGTTGLVALKQNKQFIGIELNPEYIEIAEARIKPFLEQDIINTKEVKS